MGDDALRERVEREMRPALQYGNRQQRKKLIADAVEVACRLVQEERDGRQLAIDNWRREKQRAEAAESRVANEIAARQRAQEHGIGDRARIEELERALRDWRTWRHVENCGCNVLPGHPDSRCAAGEESGEGKRG